MEMLRSPATPPPYPDSRTQAGGFASRPFGRFALSRYKPPVRARSHSMWRSM